MCVAVSRVGRNGVQICSSCRMTMTALMQQPIINTSMATNDLTDSAATQLAMKITAAARTVIRLSTLSCRFVDVAVVIIVQPTIAAASEYSGRQLILLFAVHQNAPSA